MWKPAILADSLVAGETLRVTRIKAKRGNILGRDDRPIVVPRPVIRFGIDKTRVPAAQVADSARRLAAVLDITADRLRPLGAKGRTEGVRRGAGAAP